MVEQPHSDSDLCENAGGVLIDNALKSVHKNGLAQHLPLRQALLQGISLLQISIA